MLRVFTRLGLEAITELPRRGALAAFNLRETVLVPHRRRSKMLRKPLDTGPVILAVKPGVSCPRPGPSVVGSARKTVDWNLGPRDWNRRNLLLLPRVS